VSSSIDPRARRILFDAYWSPQGWRSPRKEPSAEDLAFAKAAGVMFDRVRMTHDMVLARVVEARSLVDLESVAAGFAASLASRAVHLRPALASYHAAWRVSPHELVGAGQCSICGEFDEREHDFSSTNFARLKWGLVPRFFTVDHAFVLEMFAAEGRPRPTDEDRKILQEILQTASSMPPEARARDLERALKPVLRSNQAERELLIEILCTCGVLVPSRQTEKDYRAIPSRTDWTDGGALWRGDDGIDRDRARFLFGPQLHVVR
jgi:hypothetical protein